ncbi:MAG: hypothetical protein RR390_00425 [Hafnia sp.]
MKEYLKMSDYFNAAMSAPVSTDDEMYCSDSFIAEFTCRSHAIAASHAVNSHDELVDSLQSVTNERDELAKEVERLKVVLAQCADALFIADRFCGVHTADECDDSVAIPIHDAHLEVRKYL